MTTKSEINKLLKTYVNKAIQKIKESPEYKSELKRLKEESKRLDDINSGKIKAPEMRGLTDFIK